ncbi:MAG: hypothetical protein KJZ80_16355 [Hyphomicrobiaceae bacterium]|nr:hypothetical protein [Hyphomicrobiaceae bacterium]
MDGGSQAESTQAAGRSGGAGSHSIRRALALAVLGAALAWLVLTHSFAAYLAETAPELALSFNAGQPVALVRLAGTRLDAKDAEAPSAEQDATPSAGGPSRLTGFAAKGARPAATESGREPQPDAGNAGQPPDPADAAAASATPEADPDAPAAVRALAEQALALDPLNAQALRLLAQVAAAEGEADRVVELMQAAARRSRRETAAIHFMMRRSFEAKDYAGTLEHADTILRTAPHLARFVVPTLARIAEDEDIRHLLEQRLAANPPWRAAVLSALPGAITDARTPLNLLLSLRETASPPTAADLRGYLDFLIRNGFFELAYYVWLQFLPPEHLTSTGLLFNGSFELAPSSLPFDWVIAGGSGVAIQVAPAADLETGGALLIEFGQGRVDFGRVQQMVLLAPGDYRVEGRFRGELVGRRGLVWRIACVGKRPMTLGQSQMIAGQAPTWRPFEAAFTVPENDCRAQQIRLTHDARSASEQFISGAVWIADLRIVRQ